LMKAKQQGKGPAAGEKWEYCPGSDLVYFKKVFRFDYCNIFILFVN
jgi:hypothetical protein